jgi:hypothetical protein
MAHLRFPGFTLLSLVCVVACGPDKDATGTMVNSTTGTDSNSSAPGTTAGPDGETPASDPTSSSSTSGPAVTTSTSPATSVGTMTDDTGPGETGSTTGGECVIEVPPPGSCNGVAPLTKRPTSGLQLELPKHAGEDEPFAASTGTSGTTTEGDSTSCQFICEPDGGGGQECDLFAQDCADGEKCNPFANDGGNSWNASKCVPVGPDQIGEACTVEGGGTSGFDSCAKGAMCWDVDFATGEGTCVALCTCSLEQPICEVVNTQCAIANDGVIILCLPVCDPLNPVACAPDEVCIQSGDNFSCVLDASGDVGAAGDGCSFANGCDPGLFCGAADESCADVGCCAPFCALDNPVCPAGKECQPWFEEGAAPMCFEDLGACI